MFCPLLSTYSTALPSESSICGVCMCKMLKVRDSSELPKKLEPKMQLNCYGQKETQQ